MGNDPVGLSERGGLSGARNHPTPGVAAKTTVRPEVGGGSVGVCGKRQIPSFGWKEELGESALELQIAVLLESGIGGRDVNRAHDEGVPVGGGFDKVDSSEAKGFWAEKGGRNVDIGSSLDFAARLEVFVAVCRFIGAVGTFDRATWEVGEEEILCRIFVMWRRVIVKEITCQCVDFCVEVSQQVFPSPPLPIGDV
jgi:hypothetical protein